jgi:hypothetical protein
MANSALKTSLHALTVSFTDSVMAAIRGASLEDLLGEAPRDPRRPTSTPRIERASTSEVLLEHPLGGHALSSGKASLSARPDRPAGTRSRRSGDSAVATSKVSTGTQSPPGPAAEITDPQRLLAMGAPLPAEVVGRQVARERVPEGPASTVRALGSGFPVRLRANETLARVSNGGIVIRRAK